MAELDELLEKHNKYLEYERTKLQHDTPEDREMVFRGFKRLLDRMNELWGALSEHEKEKYIKSLKLGE